MLSVHDLEIRVGARTLMEGVSFRVDRGDKVGLVGISFSGITFTGTSWASWLPT